MIRAILITAILFLSYAYFCDTLQVTLHHNAYKKNSSQIEIRCSGQVAKKEMILNLTISKDGRQFYSYNNRTNVETITVPIPGIPSIQRIEPGHFALTRINKTTSGYYNCSIFSNITQNSIREYIQVNDNYNNSLNLCGDWTQYEYTKCIKVIEKVGTEKEALKNCTQLDQSSGLLTIHSKEEQEFYNNLLEKYQNISLIAWIGMEYIDKAFKWIDGTAVEFENWSNDAVKDGGDLCVQMSLQKDVGKWIDESCKKKALIVCQKKQEINLNKLRIAFESKIESLEKEITELRANCKLGTFD